jgi:hypothetical protein
LSAYTDIAGGAEPVGPRRDTHVAGGDGGVLQVSGVDHFEEHGPSGFVEAAVAELVDDEEAGLGEEPQPGGESVLSGGLLEPADEV